MTVDLSGDEIGLIQESLFVKIANLEQFERHCENQQFAINAERNTGNTVRSFIALHGLMLCACVEGDLVMFHSQANYNSDIVKRTIKFDVLCKLGVRDIKNDFME